MLNSYHPGLLRAAARRTRQLLTPLQEQPQPQLSTYDAVVLLWAFGVLQQQADPGMMRRLVRWDTG